MKQKILQLIRRFRSWIILFIIVNVLVTLYALFLEEAKRVKIDEIMRYKYMEEKKLEYLRKVEEDKIRVFFNLKEKEYNAYVKDKEVQLIKRLYDEKNKCQFNK